MASTFDLLKTAKHTCLNNIRTDVLLDMLVLCGAARAKTDAEKNLIVYIAARDQNYRGRGLAGFTINAMPWEGLEFTSQQQFLIAVIDDVLACKGWSKLGYSPNIEYFSATLADIRTMVA